MNAVLPPTLPSSRDLPPHRHAQIRAELQRAATAPRHDHRRLVPVLAAALAVLAVVALAVWLVPDRHTRLTEPAGRRTTPPPPPTSQGARPEPVIPGLSASDRHAIEQGCGTSAFGVGDGQNPPTPGLTDTRDTVRLYNLTQDQAGRLALLYGERAVLNCDLDWPSLPYNAGFGGMLTPTWPPPSPIVVDTAGSGSGGDVGGNKAIYRGLPGTEFAGGRISDQVAKVTYTQGSDTVTAALANGTFLVRIVHPSTWAIPDNYPRGVIRAYDAAGKLLAEI
jgi:hypothetical protein